MGFAFFILTLSMRTVWPLGMRESSLGDLNKARNGRYTRSMAGRSSGRTAK
jgi:hypothetical protein